MTINKSSIREQISTIKQLTKIHQDLLLKSEDKHNKLTQADLNKLSVFGGKLNLSNQNVSVKHNPSFQSLSSHKPALHRPNKELVTKMPAVDQLELFAPRQFSLSSSSRKAPYFNGILVNRSFRPLPAGLSSWAQTKLTPDSDSRGTSIVKYIGRSNSNHIPGVIISNRNGDNFEFVPPHTLVSGSNELPISAT